METTDAVELLTTCVPLNPALKALAEKPLGCERTMKLLSVVPFNEGQVIFEAGEQAEPDPSLLRSEGLALVEKRRFIAAAGYLPGPSVARSRGAQF